MAHPPFVNLHVPPGLPVVPVWRISPAYYMTALLFKYLFVKVSVHLFVNEFCYEGHVFTRKCYVRKAFKRVPVHELLI